MRRFDDDEDDKPSAGKDSKAKPKPRRTALGLAVNGFIGTLAVVVAGTGFRAWQTGADGDLYAGPAFDPWRLWDSGELKGIDGIITAATLAPSPHNSQPWKFAVGENAVDLLADGSRSLGAIDPVGREMFIGLGCALENMVIGARAMGFSPVVNLFPDSQAAVGRDGGRVARVLLYAGERNRPAEADVLTRRHTNRGPYVRDRAVGNDVTAALNDKVLHGDTRLVWLQPDSTFGEMFSTGTLEATEAFVADKELHAASLKWFRHDLTTVNATRDGLTLMTAGLKPFEIRAALMLTQGLIGDPHRQWVEMTRDVHLPTAASFGVIAVPSLDDKAALVETGRLWQRLHLLATAEGLAMQPLNQMMEIADRDRALGRASPTADKLAGIIGFPDAVAAFGFRMGYPVLRTNLSPRRGVDQVKSA